MARWNQRMKMNMLALLGLAACAGGGADGPRPTAQDRDGDGLSNVEEAELRTNPDAADTDRDGWDDGDEVEQNTDPLNGFDYPYTGGWPIADCRNDVQATGNGVGGVAENFSLMDQHGDPVRLHDFCDRSVIIASSAGWCIPCQLEATFLKAMYDQYKDDGLMVITLMGQDVKYTTPSQAELALWADEFDLITPVVQDTSFTVTKTFASGQDVNLPVTTFIGPGSVVVARDLATVDEDDVIALLGL